LGDRIGWLAFLVDGLLVNILSRNLVDDLGVLYLIVIARL
jgi:hypothetical protein